MTLLGRIRAWAHSLNRDVHALWIAARSPHTPLIAKLLAALVAAYAFSPIDLIPDFIPVIGMLDDLLLVPIGIEIALRLIPHDLMEQFRAEAELRTHQPRSWVAAAVICALWLLFILWLSWEALKYH